MGNPTFNGYLYHEIQQPGPLVKGWAERRTMKEQTYEELILTHLQRYKQLTDVEARERFGTNRASEYIRRLREKGYMIETDWVTSKNRYGKKVKHGVYVYVK